MRSCLKPLEPGQCWGQKADAMKAWSRARKPPLDYILDSLAKFKKSYDWNKDGGRYVPHPTTWINGERWHDEPGFADTSLEREMDYSFPKGWTDPSWLLEEPEKVH
jgi:hypothetical protein